jgi:putative ABC transport system permease protein
MTWRDAIALARRSVGRRGSRAVLTVLAVALGAALLSSLLIASSAAKARVLDQVSAGGPLAGIKVDAAAPTPVALDSDNPRPGAPRRIDDAALARIERLPDVASVSPIVVTPMVVVLPEPLPAATGARARRDTSPIFDGVIGIDVQHADRLPVSLLAGRLPAPGSQTEVAVTSDFLSRLDIASKNAPSVVGVELTLGAPRDFASAVGRRTRARWTRAEIVGVVSQDAGSGLLVGSLELGRAAQAWTAAGTVPAAGATGGSGPVAAPPSYSALFVVARGLERVAAVRTEINAVGYSTSAPESLITQVQRYVHVVELVLAGIGVIGLAIAAIGISNAMLAAIRERRREIGVLKAVGASDRDVRRVFLVEAGTLGFVGGVIGAAVGLSSARVLATVVNRYLAGEGLQTVRLGFPALLLGGVVAGATLLALGAGTLPAIRAARMPARQAIGDE